MNKVFAPIAMLLGWLNFTKQEVTMAKHWSDWEWAKQQLLDGRKVRRYAWPKGQFVYNKPGAGLFRDGIGYYHSNDADMKATDWELASTEEDLK